MKVGQNQRVHLLSVEDSTRSMWTKTCASSTSRSVSQLAVSCLSGHAYTCATWTARQAGGAPRQGESSWITRFEGAGNVLIEASQGRPGIVNSLPPSHGTCSSRSTSCHVIFTDAWPASASLQQAERERRPQRAARSRRDAVYGAAQQQLADSPSALAVRQAAGGCRTRGQEVASLHVRLSAGKQGHVEAGLLPTSSTASRASSRALIASNNANLATDASRRSAHYSGNCVYTTLSTHARCSRRHGIVDSGASNHYFREA